MAIQVGYTIFKIDNPFFYPETSELSNALLSERSFGQRCVTCDDGCDEQAASTKSVPETSELSKALLSERS